jgi:hypothetical protein
MLCQGIILLFSERASDALAVFDQSEPLLPAVFGLALHPAYVFLRCLALLACCPKLSIPSGGASSLVVRSSTSHSSCLPIVLPPSYDGELVLSRLCEADRLIAQMQIWATHAPSNYSNKLHLMQAERYRVAIFSHLAAYELLLPAMQEYDAAIEKARSNQLCIEEALSLELSACFYANCQRASPARYLAVECISAYERAGVVLKTRILQAEHHPLSSILLLSRTPSASPSSANGMQSPLAQGLSHKQGAGLAMASRGSPSVRSRDRPRSSARRPSNSNSNGGGPAPLLTPPPSHYRAPNSNLPPSLDALSVLMLKATASFSTEKNQSKLLKRLMSFVLETAGLK